MKIHCSYREHNLKPLLEKIPAAKKVTVLTYSLDDYPKSHLLEALKKLPMASRLTIVTNIPGRWKDYSQVQKPKMKKRFDTYLNNLAPENFDCVSEVYFSFKNHAKILIVDDMAYVGSANFTAASANKYEAGVILTDKGELEQLEAFIKTILSSSIPLLKATACAEARPLLRLLSWRSAIVRSIREENGFIKGSDGEWVEDLDENREPRRTIQVSDKLLAFLTECRISAESLLNYCGGDQEILNRYMLAEVLEFVRHFEEKRYNYCLPRPFSEERMAESLVEELLNQCSSDGTVDEVIGSSEYQERMEEAKSDYEQELKMALADAVEELVEYVDTAASRLRSSFEPEDVSPEIDNVNA